jgi:glycosyltransferase involved in cell wall biosynthesis
MEKKGFLYLVRAAAASGVAVVIAGEGPQRAELEAEIARLSAPVTLLGAQQPDAVRALLETAAVFVMPCVVAADGDRDSMPVVVKEAMAMEIPVIVTDEVGLPELVTPACARVVEPGDAEALAVALRECWRSPTSARRPRG